VGGSFRFAPADLPQEVARAALERIASEDGLDLGIRDEDTHARLEEASPKIGAKAEHRARMARFIVAKVGLGRTKVETFKAAQREFGVAGNSDKSLFRLVDSIEGVAVANVAPTLLENHHMDGRNFWPARNHARPHKLF